MPEPRIESPPTAAPRLLERLREAIRARHYSARTAEAYVFWVRKYVLFHGRRHPDRLGPAEIKSFLTYLAVTRGAAPSSQNQALAALLFLYRRVLGRELDAPKDLIRAKRPFRIPTVLSPGEIVSVFQHLRGVHFLACMLMYGSGLRLLESLQLRVQDVDFAREAIIVRDGKGQKERHTLLPSQAVPLLRAHIARLEQEHHRGAHSDRSPPFVPDTVLRKTPNARS
jgi:integrase